MIHTKSNTAPVMALTLPSDGCRLQAVHYERGFVRQPSCKDRWLQALQLQRGNGSFVGRSVMTQDDAVIMGRLSVIGQGQPSQACPQISVGRCLTELQLISRRALFIEAQPTPLVLSCSHSTSICIGARSRGELERASRECLDPGLKMLRAGYCNNQYPAHWRSDY